MNKIQLFAMLKDLTPTEPDPVDLRQFIRIEDNKSLWAANGDCVKAYSKSIEKEGMKTALEIYENGYVIDGNCRFRSGIYLNWKFAPIIVREVGFKFDGMISPDVIGGAYNDKGLSPNLVGP